MQLFQGDCLAVLPSLPDNSVDLILTDPPYYRVKSNDWDNQWSSEAEFLAWCEQVLLEFVRVLKPNGSLYWFAGPYMAAKLELLIDRHYKVLNHLVWVKKSGKHNGCHKEGLRKYFPQTERIIFAEPMQASGLRDKSLADASRSLFKPLVDVMNTARQAAGLTISECEAICGTTTVGHYFSVSQFHFPNEVNFIKLMTAFGDAENYEALQAQHRLIREQYLKLKGEYEVLRRAFSVTKDVPFTDVWHFDPVQFYAGKHPCEKPMALLEHIVKTSSRPGQVVLDAFMGSGSTGDACLNLGREFVGVEADRDNFEAARIRITRNQTARILQRSELKTVLPEDQSEGHEHHAQCG